METEPQRKNGLIVIKEGNFSEEITALLKAQIFPRSAGQTWISLLAESQNVNLQSTQNLQACFPKGQIQIAWMGLVKQRD